MGNRRALLIYLGIAFLAIAISGISVRQIINNSRNIIERSGCAPKASEESCRDTVARFLETLTPEQRAKLLGRQRRGPQGDKGDQGDTVVGARGPRGLPPDPQVLVRIIRREVRREIERITNERPIVGPPGPIGPVPEVDYDRIVNEVIERIDPAPEPVPTEQIVQQVIQQICATTPPGQPCLIKP
jgi:hypothetical protein